MAKTIEITIYKFEELSKEAKEKAIQQYRDNSGNDNQFIYDEAHETVKAFHEAFGTTEGGRSWLEVSFNNIEDNVLELKGMRLRTYILNNFGTDLFTPKYIGSLKVNEIVKHKRIKSKPLSNGNVFNPYYSGCQVDNSCVLTGVCYDQSLLQPIYDFISWNEKPDYNTYEDFQNLIEDCFKNLERDIELEVDAMNMDDYIIEQIEANDYDFTEEGEIY